MRGLIIIPALHPDSLPRVSGHSRSVPGFVTFCLCLLLGLFAGCVFYPPTKPLDLGRPAPPAVYPSRSTPESTLIYLQTAWELRDSVRVDSVYAPEYQGSSVDNTDPTAGALFYAKSDEVRVVAAMANAKGITFLDMDLKATNTWVRSHYVSDPSGWATLQIPVFNIEIHDFERGDFAASSSDAAIWVFEFTFKPTLDAASPTDTTWQIVRWQETKTAQ